MAEKSNIKTFAMLRGIYAREDGGRHVHYGTSGERDEDGNFVQRHSIDIDLATEAGKKLAAQLHRGGFINMHETPTAAIEEVAAEATNIDDLLSKAPAEVCAFVKTMTSKADLNDVKDAETAGKARKTVLDAVDAQLSKAV